MDLSDYSKRFKLVSLEPRKAKKNEAEKVLKEIMAENLPTLERETKPQIQEAEQTLPQDKSEEIHDKAHHK